MRAMILAAGKGTRMRELTANTPKPMLKAAGKTLIEYQIEALAKAGIDEIVINHARFGDQIEQYLGSGAAWDVSIEYSREGDEPLETAGGIIKALPLLGEGPFLALNADVWTDFDYSSLKIEGSELARIVLVNNPQHNPAGDFALNNNVVINKGENMLTFAGIGCYQSSLFYRKYNESKLSLAPILRDLADQQQLSGYFHEGQWIDVGTPERLHVLDSAIRKQTKI